MSSDFDKSDADEGIDFHEAERLSVEHFEKTYPEFIALFNSTIRKAIGGGAWNVDLAWWRRNQWDEGVVQLNGNKPLKNDANTYLMKLGFSISHPTTNIIRVNWQRRDGGKYP